MRRNLKGITESENEEDNKKGRRTMLETFSDAEFQGNDEFRALCGSMVMVRGTSMIIKSKVMGEIEKLVMGSEAQALSDATDSAEILEEVFSTLHNKYFGGVSPFEVDVVGSYVDNESVVKAVMTKDRQYLSVHAPDHVVLKLAHFSDQVQNNKRRLYHVGTTYNPTDHLTKFNCGKKVQLHSMLIMNDRFGVFDLSLRRKVGESVRCRKDYGDEYFTGTVKRVRENGTYDVEFEGGKRKDRVHSSELYEEW